MSTQDIILRYILPLLVFLAVLVTVLVSKVKRPVLSSDNLSLLPCLVFAATVAILQVELCIRYDRMSKKYARLARAVTRLHETIARTNDNQYVTYVISELRKKVIAGYGSNILVHAEQSKD